MRLVASFLLLLASPAAAEEVCLTAPYEKEGAGLGQIYGEVRLALAPFPSLASALEMRAPALCYGAGMGNAHAYFDPEANRIYVSPDLTGDMQVAVLLHEIRHLDQFSTGACPTDDLAMREYAFATFALEADASAMSLMVAWDMKENGVPGVWEALSSWDTQADIAARFAAEMAASGDVEHAVSGAFEQWYASKERRDMYYVATCSDYLDRQEAAKALPRYQIVSADFYERLCILPDGTPYACAKPDFEAHSSGGE